MASLIERLKKNSSISESAILEESKFFAKKVLIPTPIPVLNILQSGKMNGGFGPGITLWAGPSKHFKTGFVLINIKAYMDKYPDAVCLFYDSEFGTPQSYFKRNGINTSRVFHTPVTNVEALKFDLVKQLDGLTRDDHVIIAIDSVGNLASKKEVEDALEGKSVADMSRAKAFKSLFRIIAPILTMKDIPLHAVAHTYETMEMYAKQVVSGGTGQYYSADNIYILGRQQEKGTGAEEKDIVGWNFVVNVEKSRYVREKSKIIVQVRYETGVSKWSGLLELAEEFGLVVKPKAGYYSRPTVKDDKSWRKAETNCKEFWGPILTETNFGECIEQKYLLPEGEQNASSERTDPEDDNEEMVEQAVE